MTPRQQVEGWLAERGWRARPFQKRVWTAWRRGRSGLVHSATGSGKTYALWLAEVMAGLAERDAGKAKGTAKRSAPLRLLWITPMRALAEDTVGALRAPVADLELPWRIESRTGDTSPAVRARQQRRLPTVLVTTPESLCLQLTRSKLDARLADLSAVVVDEWHELLGNKRGVQVELALARLRTLRPDLKVWGLSATLGNLEEAAVALAGPEALSIHGDEKKRITIDALIPPEMERFPWAGHLGLRLLPQVVAAVDEAESALVFTNTRSQAERWYQAILEARPDWAGALALHHGSLDRSVREWVENGLRQGTLRCVVATSTLDLGVDFSPVDRVLQIGSPKGVARLLQRAGRSGHSPGRESRVTCVPTHALELLEIAAVRDAARAQEIEERRPPVLPLDVLAQHLVTLGLGEGFDPDQVLAEARSSRAFAELSDAEWQWTLDFVTRGGSALKAYPEFSKLVERDGRLAIRDGALARRHRLSIGTIVGDSSIEVRFRGGRRLGTVEESFIARLRPGDRFQFAGRTLELHSLRDLTAWVRVAESKVHAVPRWAGGRMPLSTSLSRAVRRRLTEAREGRLAGLEMKALRPLLALQEEISALPAAGELLVEELPDLLSPSGRSRREGHHLFVYPFAGRLVHEGLAALWAYRLSRIAPNTFTWAVNDYGIDLLSPEPPALGEPLTAGLLSPEGLADDLPAALDASELARRQFREIARVAGLVFQGYPGKGKTMRQLQASSGLFFDVFDRHDPENLLLQQAYREVRERQLEASRLRATLERLNAGTVVRVECGRPSPLAFPLLVDRMRETTSGEGLVDRIRRMRLRYERAATRNG
ncbi:MAG: ligase-associated DNA damage response DEXH box helicase [Acidobacteriota bacterium]